MFLSWSAAHGGGTAARLSGRREHGVASAAVGVGVAWRGPVGLGWAGLGWGARAG